MHRMGGKSRAAGQDKTLASMDPSGYFLSFYLWIYLSSVFYYILSYRAGIDTRRPARGNVAYLSIDGPTHIMPPSLSFFNDMTLAGGGPASGQQSPHACLPCAIIDLIDSPSISSIEFGVCTHSRTKERE